MEDSHLEKITEIIKSITKLISEKKFCEIEKLTNQTRLTAKEIEDAISDYGETIVFLPEEGFTNLDIIEIVNSVPKAWSVRYDLWTKEEGRSDLSLELTLTQNNTGNLKVEIDNIHVL